MLNPTPLPTSNPKYKQNYFAALGIDDDDDVTVVMSNCTHEAKSHAGTAATENSSDDDSLSDEDNWIPMQTSATAATRTIQANNLAQLQQTTIIVQKPKTEKPVHHAISDSGATGHFLVAGAPVVNKNITTNPIKITLPNGKTIQSTHTCNLDIPWLPAHMNEAHGVEGMGRISQFFYASLNIVFSRIVQQLFSK